MKKNILKQYESIIKNKLKKPIDLKKLYYSQFEKDILKVRSTLDKVKLLDKKDIFGEEEK